MGDKRIVSLIPSATEIVAALGFQDQLVGRSHECDFPKGVETLPFCTEPKFKPDGTSREINQSVKEILRNALAVYSVDSEQLNQLKPTHIITQNQCEVCAVSLSDVEEAVCQIIDSKPEIISLSPNSLDDVWADICKVAIALEVPEKGAALIAKIKDRLDLVAKKFKPKENLPRVATIEWIEPLMAGGNWMPSLVEMAGGVNLFGQAGKHSPWMEWEELKKSNPDVLLILPCGYNIDKTKKEMTSLSCLDGWDDLKAVKQGKVFLLDGNQYFNRPGPRLVESLEILAEIIHPELFHFGYQGQGWIQY